MKRLIVASTDLSNQVKSAHIRRNIMAKGQQHKNKEVKKPKQDKKVVVVSGAIRPIVPSTAKK